MENEAADDKAADDKAADDKAADDEAADNKTADDEAADDKTADDEAADEAAGDQAVDEAADEAADKEAAEERPRRPRPTTPLNLLVDPDLLSPQLDRLQISLPSDLPQELDSGLTTALRQQVQVNQKHANGRSRQQYGKQRQNIVFAVGTKVSVAVPALDRASTDDKQIFGRVIDVQEDYDSYQILTKHGLLDRCYPISQLNLLPNHIDLGISNPPPTKWVSLHYCAAQESTTEKVPVHCNWRDQKTWCSTRRCLCVKAEAKCEGRSTQGRSIGLTRLTRLLGCELGRVLACEGAGEADCLASKAAASNTREALFPSAFLSY